MLHKSIDQREQIERLEVERMLPITLAIDSGYNMTFNAHFLLEKAIISAMCIRDVRKTGFFRTKEFIRKQKVKQVLDLSLWH